MAEEQNILPSYFEILLLNKRIYDNVDKALLTVRAHFRDTNQQIYLLTALVLFILFFLFFGIIIYCTFEKYPEFPEYGYTTIGAGYRKWYEMTRYGVLKCRKKLLQCQLMLNHQLRGTELTGRELDIETDEERTRNLISEEMAKRAEYMKRRKHHKKSRKHVEQNKDVIKGIREYLDQALKGKVKKYRLVEKEVPKKITIIGKPKRKIPSPKGILKRGTSPKKSVKFSDTENVAPIMNHKAKKQSGKPKPHLPKVPLAFALQACADHPDFDLKLTTSIPAEVLAASHLPVRLGHDLLRKARENQYKKD